MCAVQKIAEGELSRRVETKGQDAIQKLARSINIMANRIEKIVLSTQALSTNISHEIRTPLTQIKIALGILQKQLYNYDNPDVTDKIDSIDEDIQKIDMLVGRILEYAKQDLIEFTEIKTAVCLKEIILTVFNGLSIEINHKGLKIDTQWETLNTSVWANPNSMHLAFSNLISNAIKFSPNGGSVELSFLDNNKHQTIIRITNTCRPLAYDKFEKIFLPFYRGTKNGTEGTGLGLAIVQKIIKNHEGTITAQEWKNNDRILFEIVLPSISSGLIK